MLLFLLGGVSITCCLSVSEGLGAAKPAEGAAAGVTIIVRDPATEESGKIRIPYKIAEFMLRHASLDSEITVNDVGVEMKALRAAVLGKNEAAPMKYQDGQGHVVEIVVVPPDKGTDTKRKE
jgi:hypothetical protein